MNAAGFAKLAADRLAGVPDELAHLALVEVDLTAWRALLGQAAAPAAGSAERQMYDDLMLGAAAAGNVEIVCVQAARVTMIAGLVPPNPEFNP